MEILAVTWLAGAVGLYALGIGNYLRFRRKLRYAWKVKGNVYLLDHIDTPFAAGILRPRSTYPLTCRKISAPILWPMNAAISVAWTW